MGSGASFDMGMSEEGGSGRFFCHTCQRVFQLGGVSSPQDYYCPHCQSTFLEELNANHHPSHRHSDILLGGHSHLSSEQNRRISNATAMLRLLETQLREELEQLQVAYEAANVQINGGTEKAKMTKLLLGKLRKTPLSLDAVCSQPSCPICSEDFALGSEAVKLPCGHLFHRVCVLHWLNMKQNCPICRSTISNEMPTRQELSELSEPELRDWLVELDVDIHTQPMTENKDGIERLLHSSLLEYQRLQEEQHTVQERQAQQNQQSQNPFLRFRLAAAPASGQHAFGTIAVPSSSSIPSSSTISEPLTHSLAGRAGIGAALRSGSLSIEARSLVRRGLLEEGGAGTYEGRLSGNGVVLNGNPSGRSASLHSRGGADGILLGSRRYDSSEGILQDFHRVLQSNMQSNVNNMNNQLTGVGTGGLVDPPGLSGFLLTDLPSTANSALFNNAGGIYLGRLDDTPAAPPLDDEADAGR